LASASRNRKRAGAAARKSLAGLVLLVAIGPVRAQFSAGVAAVTPPDPLIISSGGKATAKIHVRLQTGYHTNSHTPSDEYLIPLRLTWEAPPLRTENVLYPKPRLEKYPFSEKPLSVVTGDFDISTEFSAPASAPKGGRTVIGKLRYQACSDKACLPPRTIEIRLPVEIR
jgi:hypothetical protein